VRLGGGSMEVPWFRDPRTGEVARCTETTEYDPLTRVFSVSLELRFMESERPPERLGLELRQLWPDETRILLQRNGFEVLRETDGAGDSVAYVCRAAV
jgi:hypothetical protein